MMLAAAYRSASTQIQDQKDQFNAVFDKALRQQSDAFDDLSWADVKAQKTAILASISEEVEIEIRVLGIDWSWSIETPNLEQGVNCVVQKARGFETHPLLSSFPELGRSNLTPDSFNQLELLLVDQGLATKENVDCEACSQFAGLAEGGCRSLALSPEGLTLLKSSFKELENANESVARAKRSLRAEFEGRLGLLPLSVRSQVRDAMESDDAVDIDYEWVTTDTELGPVSHQALRCRPDFGFVEAEIALQTASVRLPNQHQPWKSQYPTRNNCARAPQHCSAIKVTVPAGKDYLIVVKDARDRTVNHGYVRAGTTGEFEVNDGAYTTYFITGIGWNAAKRVPCSDCGTLYGYFNTDVQISKSDLESLRSQSLTYTMVETTYGNFSPDESSLEEVL